MRNAGCHPRGAEHGVVPLGTTRYKEAKTTPTFLINNDYSTSNKRVHIENRIMRDLHRASRLEASNHFQTSHMYTFD